MAVGVAGARYRWRVGRAGRGAASSTLDLRARAGAPSSFARDRRDWRLPAAGSLAVRADERAARGCSTRSPGIDPRDGRRDFSRPRSSAASSSSRSSTAFCAREIFVAGPARWPPDPVELRDAAWTSRYRTGFPFTVAMTCASSRRRRVHPLPERRGGTARPPAPPLRACSCSTRCWRACAGELPPREGRRAPRAAPRSRPRPRRSAP